MTEIEELEARLAMLSRDHSAYLEFGNPAEAYRIVQEIERTRSRIRELQKQAAK